MTLLEYKKWCEELGIEFDEGFFYPHNEEFMQLKMALVAKLHKTHKLRCYRGTSPYVWVDTPRGCLQITENKNNISIYLNGEPHKECSIDIKLEELLKIVSELS